VLISLPGITWKDLEDPALHAIPKLMPSIAALSARTAARAANIARSYMTLGAGDPAFAATDDPQINLAFERNDPFENGTAAEAATRRSGVAARGELVHVGTDALQRLQATKFYGTVLGSLGDSLRDAHVVRAVVSADDVALHPKPDEMRRASVLALADGSGSVDRGKLDGLLRPDPRAPFGVSTDPEKFVRAARTALDGARVVLLDPGETARADEFLNFVAPERVGAIRRAAVRRADAIVERLRSLLRASDMVIVLSPSGPTPPVFREHLAPIGAWGRGTRGETFGRNWLLSATTRRQGMTALSDVAPTVLEALGIEKPDAMVGTPIRSGEVRSAGPERLIDLDYASSVRERFATGAFWVIAIVLSLLAILAFVAFLGGGFFRPLVAVAYFGLAMFPAAHIIRAFEYWHAGVIGAHLLLYTVAAALAIAASFLPGPRWAGGVALMLLSALLYGSDVAMGGPLQLNGVFGHSPLVAGRFYGVSNPGYAILFAATLLGLTGLAELRGRRTLPTWSVIALLVLLVVDGLPAMGADLGGLLAGIPAVGITIALGRGIRIRWKTIVFLIGAAVALALGLSFIDYLRPPDARTHLGRFAALLISHNGGELGTTLHRKAAASLTSLTVTRWTYFIPVGVAVLTLLLIRPRGVLRDVLSNRPLLRAGLWGTLAAGVLGFAVNDSGISIPAVALAFTVGFLVLIAIDTVSPRKPRPRDLS
jgi:hypothetical protein